MINTTTIYPQTLIDIHPGDILYSPIGRSTYFVGHAVIIGEDYMVKEILPKTPGWQSLSIERFWNRHHYGDEITLLRSPKGANQAAHWITTNLEKFKTYSLTNFDVHHIEKSYCYKFVVQAYYLGANVEIVHHMNRPLFPLDIKRSSKLERVAIMER